MWGSLQFSAKILSQMTIFHDFLYHEIFVFKITGHRECHHLLRWFSWKIFSKKKIKRSKIWVCIAGSTHYCPRFCFIWWVSIFIALPFATNFKIVHFLYLSTAVFQIILPSKSKWFGVLKEQNQQNFRLRRFMIFFSFFFGKMIDSYQLFVLLFYVHGKHLWSYRDGQVIYNYTFHAKR